MLARLSVYILFFLGLLASNHLTAQNFMVKAHLSELKNGALLVKLYTRNNSIKAHRESGREEKANNLEKEQSFKNLAIVKAFEKKYNFSPKVYFFYSDDSGEIMDWQFKGNLMGYDMQVLNYVEIGATFYIAEFGNTEGSGINALVIMDKESNQLEKPFPYFTRTFEGLFFLERSYDQTVELWNEKLHTAYEYYH